MTALILPRRFTSQPQDAVDIDWDNPLTQGLIAGFTGTSLFDATGRNKIALSGTGEIGATNKGLALIGNNTSATGSLAIDLSPYRGFSYSGWVYVSDQSAVGADDMLFEYTNNLNNTAGAFAFDMKPAAGYVDITLKTSTYYTSARFVAPSTGWHYISAIINLDLANPYTFSLFIDGHKIPVYSTPFVGANPAFPNSTLYLMSRGNASLFYAGKLAGFSIHGRAISDGEANDLAQNPWQLFRARPRVLYFNVGGATDTPSAASSGSLSITGSAANAVRALAGVAASGSITLTGSNAAALRTWLGVAGAGSITLTGSDAAGVKAGSGAYTSAADAGSITLSGSAAVGTYDRLAAAGSGSITLTGSDASGIRNIPATAEAGSIALTGSAAVGIRTWLAAAEAGSITLTGSDAEGVFGGAMTLTQADLDAIAAAVWADPAAVAAHAKLDAIIARITC